MQMKAFRRCRQDLKVSMAVFSWLISFYLFPMHKHSHLMLKFETIALIKSLLICYRGKGVFASSWTDGEQFDLIVTNIQLLLQLELQRELSFAALSRKVHGTDKILLLTNNYFLRCQSYFLGLCFWILPTAINFVPQEDWLPYNHMPQNTPSFSLKLTMPSNNPFRF